MKKMSSACLKEKERDQNLSLRVQTQELVYLTLPKDILITKNLNYIIDKLLNLKES